MGMTMILLSWRCLSPVAAGLSPCLTATLMPHWALSRSSYFIMISRPVCTYLALPLPRFDKLEALGGPSFSSTVKDRFSTSLVKSGHCWCPCPLLCYWDVRCTLYAHYTACHRPCIAQDTLTDCTPSRLNLSGHALSRAVTVPGSQGILS